MASKVVSDEDIRLFPDFKFNICVKAPFLTVVTFLGANYGLQYFSKFFQNPLERSLSVLKPFRLSFTQKLVLLPTIFFIYTIYYSLKFSKRKEAQIEKYRELIDQPSKKTTLPDIKAEDLLKMLKTDS